MLHHSYVYIFHSLCPKSGFRNAGTYRDMGTVLTKFWYMNQPIINFGTKIMEPVSAVTTKLEVIFILRFILVKLHCVT